MLPEFYNELGAMHGTIMVFLGVVPLAVGGFGNFVLPLQIGAPDMAFPRLNMASYWFFFLGGVTMLASFFVPGGAAQSGWTSYSPLCDHRGHGPDVVARRDDLPDHLVAARRGQLHHHHDPAAREGADVLALPVLRLGAVRHRLPAAAGVSAARGRGRSCSSWIASPARASSCRAASSSAARSLQVAGGGNPLLWQHLFWFLAHPEVYVLILPAMGIVAEIIANNTRKPLWGYRSMVYSLIFLGFMSFIVWAHHMFMTGMGTTMAAFFQTTTMIISIPSVVILTALIISLWGGSIRFNTPMLFALGVPADVRHRRADRASARAERRRHPAARHLLRHRATSITSSRRGRSSRCSRGSTTGIPKATGRRMNETLGKIHFVGSFVCMNVIFMPMFMLGLAGVSRRLFDGGASYAFAQPVAAPERRVVVGRVDPRALPAAVHLQLLLEHPERREGRATTPGTRRRSSGPRPRRRRTATSSPRRERTAGPTSTAFPGRPRTSSPQYEALSRMSMEIPYTVEVRRDTGLNNGKIGIWLFLASEVMLFGALFASYILIRIGAPSWPRGDTILNVPLATFNTIVLISSSVTMVMAWASLDAQPLRDVPHVHGDDGPARLRLPRGQVLRVQPQVPRRAASQHQQLPRHLLHADRPAHAARDRRDGGERLFLGPRREAVEDRTRRGSPTGSRTRACSGTSSIWSGSSCSRPCTCCRRHP